MKTRSFQSSEATSLPPVSRLAPTVSSLTPLPQHDNRLMRCDSYYSSSKPYPNICVHYSTYKLICQYVLIKKSGIGGCMQQSLYRIMCKNNAEAYSSSIIFSSLESETVSPSSSASSSKSSISAPSSSSESSSEEAGSGRFRPNILTSVAPLFTNLSSL